MLKYAINQILWMLSLGLQLIAAMGVGTKWMIMTVRCITFALLDIFYFLPHVFWYMTSPNIIRRVSYRSSKKTKVRNLQKILRVQQRRAAAAASVARSTAADGETAAGTDGAHPDAPNAAVSGGRANHYSSRAEFVAAAVAAAKANVNKDGDVDLEKMAATLNPADGSFVNGLPIDITEDLPELHASFANATNNSFDDAMATLQKLYFKHQKDNLGLGAATCPATTPTTTPAEASELRRSESPALAQRSNSLSFAFDDEDAADLEEEDEEDLKNLHNRSTLDIYLPVPLDALFRFIDQEKKSEQQKKASEADKKTAHGRSRRTRHPSVLQRKKFPIVISVNGGAWIVGSYLWNFLVARVLSACGYVVFCPDYRNFPQTTMEGMVLDVSDAIAWVLNNAERYNGDLEDVTLMGQSCGAHLSMMSLLSQAQQQAYEATGGDDASPYPSPSGVSYNVPRYNPRATITRYIGLSGIYNVRGLVKHFDKRGLYRDVLYQVAGGKANMPRYSLTTYFDPKRAQETGEVLPNNFFEFLPRFMYFLHGDGDKSAPVSESANLVYILRNAQRDAIVENFHNDPDKAKNAPPPVHFEYVLVPEATHTDSIIEEPLAAHDSHVAEFLRLYAPEAEIEVRRQAEARKAGGRAGQSATDSGTDGALIPTRAHTRTMSGLGAMSGSESGSAQAIERALHSRTPTEQKEADFLYPVLPVANPDRILLPTIARDKRPRVLRLASWICPF